MEGLRKKPSLIPEVALSKIFITLLPNLVRLSVEATQTWHVSDLFLQPGSLPCLTEIRLPRLDSDKTVHIDAIHMILAAAPSLKTMAADQVTGKSSIIQHETLLHLETIYCSLNDKAFEAMMRGCKRLKRLSYASDPNRRGATCRQICDALQHRATTLQSLTIGHAFGSDSDGSLKEMLGLKEIHISHWSSPYPSDSPATDNGTLFTDFLPQSVQDLR